MHCTGCGTCCREGGPLLHNEDLPLIAQAHIAIRDIVCLRKGEIVHDPVTNRLVCLEAEVLKIRGTGEHIYPWHCVFHDAVHGCRIYPHRPQQCRALFCRNTQALERMYSKNRLQRHHVFSLPQLLPQGLAALAQAHEEQCSLPPLFTAGYTVPGDGAASDALLESVRFDSAFRELSLEKAPVTAEILPFLLGRPVSQFLLSLGLVVQQNAQGQVLSLLRSRPMPDIYPI